MYFSSFSLILVWSMASPAWSQDNFSSTVPYVEKLCFNPNSNCSQRVAIKCRYKNAAGVFANCIDTNLDSQRPFLTLSRDECNQVGTAEAIITYRACNDSPQDFIPIKNENKIQFRKNVNVEPSNWDNKVDAGKCRIYELEETFDLCKENRVIDIQMDGKLSKPIPNYCRCYLYREANIDIFTTPPTVSPTIKPSVEPSVEATDKPSDDPTGGDPTASPTCKHTTTEPTDEPSAMPTSDPTVEPTDKPTAMPTFQPHTDMPTIKPTVAPTIDCEIFFTELADPVNNANAAYIEIKATCPGKVLNDIEVTTYKGKYNHPTLSLDHLIVPDDGFIIICVDKHAFEATFVGKSCDIEDNSVFPEGKYSIALRNSNSDPDKPHDVLDIYGFPEDLLPHDAIFTDGRAVRDISFTEGTCYFNSILWHIIPGEGSGTANTDDVDPRVWVTPPLKLFFTEFADPADDQEKRFIELYSPNKRNYEIMEDLFIIKYDTNSVPYDSLSLKGKVIDENGFLVLCISDWNDKCTDVLTTCSLFDGPGTAKFALSSEDCAYHPGRYCPLLDVYGLGVDGDVHDYTDGRAVRRKDVGGVSVPCSVFEIHDWVVIPGASGFGEVQSDCTDPGEWNDPDEHPLSN